MSSVSSILADLKAKGRENTRRIYSNHGMAPERTFGVSTADMKAIAKTLRGRQDVACELAATGMMEAMYLGGMVADGAKLSAAELNQWLEHAQGLQMVGEHTIPWLAVEHPQARELALKWIDSKKEHVASAGWCTYGGLVTIKPDADLDLAEIERLLDRVVNEIGKAQNRAKYRMNEFVISVGGYVKPLLAEAKAAAKKIGAVKVEMGNTDCKVPLATAYIEKIEGMGRVGKKKKTLRC
ncbi:MAG TPA: DNA alkylation repair protein [Terracidiphilus sp.]|nr:DNA alkylation repair protein [Terracidiphilus sp.]